MTRDYQDVLAETFPWFAGEWDDSLPVGTRLYSFRDYHTAPQGTRVRMGRKNGIGLIREKRGDAWHPVGATGPALTAYGIENCPSYVTEDEK